MAQVIVFFMTMVLSRLYTTEDFGQLTRYTSIVAIVISIAACRYDMTIMLPKDNKAALSVARLGMTCLSVTSVVATIIAFPLKPLVREHWGQSIATWLPMIGVTTFLLSSVTLFQFWFNRQSDYKTISLNRVEQQIGQTLGQLFFGIIGLLGVSGLILGQTVGQLWAFVNLGRKAKPLRQPLPADAPSLKDMAWRYRRMPLLNGSNALVDAVRLNGINLLIGAYSTSELGQFSLAWRVLEVPLALINGAVSQVFFHKLSTLERGEMHPLVRLTIKRAIVVGVLPFVLLAFISPWLFPLLFGHQWTSSGAFARALTPWLLMTLITSPLSNLFVVTENQDWMLVFSIVYAVVPLCWLSWSPLALLPTVFVLGVLMALMLIAMTIMADIAARRWDTQLKEAQ
ncbi:oligosaccharide flippase family protein [Actinomyces vulturis]|uniref:oligosaccharide flippase family protein n=1 Tax=Actinomyces vulturis TaxID=1857645 RepID=UPI001FDF264B|nr:oligosaccharide flippase family protein [Actinomyces vulturis]